MWRKCHLHCLDVRIHIKMVKLESFQPLAAKQKDKVKNCIFALFWGCLNILSEKKKNFSRKFTAAFF